MKLRKGWIILLISLVTLWCLWMWMVGRSKGAWKNAVRKDGLIWPQACDGKGAHSEVMDAYGI